MSPKAAAAAPSPLSELLRDPRHYRGDLRLLGRAIREGWPVEPAVREAMMQRLADLLAKGPEGIGERASLNAVDCAMAAARRNMQLLLAALGEPPQKRRAARRGR